MKKQSAFKKHELKQAEQDRYRAPTFFATKQVLGICSQVRELSVPNLNAMEKLLTDMNKEEVKS